MHYSPSIDRLTDIPYISSRAPFQRAAFVRAVGPRPPATERRPLRLHVMKFAGIGERKRNDTRAARGSTGSWRRAQGGAGKVTLRVCGMLLSLRRASCRTRVERV